MVGIKPTFAPSSPLFSGARKELRLLPISKSYVRWDMDFWQVFVWISNRAVEACRWQADCIPDRGFSLGQEERGGARGGPSLLLHCSPEAWMSRPRACMPTIIIIIIMLFTTGVNVCRQSVHSAAAWHFVSPWAVCRDTLAAGSQTKTPVWSWMFVFVALAKAMWLSSEPKHVAFVDHGCIWLWNTIFCFNGSIWNTFFMRNDNNAEHRCLRPRLCLSRVRLVTKSECDNTQVTVRRYTIYNIVETAKAEAKIITQTITCKHSSVFTDGLPVSTLTCHTLSCDSYNVSAQWEIVIDVSEPLMLNSTSKYGGF